MIKLGELVLPNDLIWDGEFEQIAVVADKEITVSGEVVVFEQALSEGKNIDLVAGEDSGWLTRQQVETLEQMAGACGAVYTLEIHGRHFTVRFRHEEAPVLEITPIRPCPEPQETDYYFGRIKLKEV